MPAEDAGRSTGTPELPTLSAFRHGMRLGLPFTPNAFVFGLVFGVLASEAGLTLIESVLMSGLVYSGTAQIAALQVGITVAGLLPIITAIVMINGRYLLMGAAIRPLYGGLPLRWLPLVLWSMGDTSWAVALREHAAGRSNAGILLGCSLMQNTFWMLATGLGYLAGSLIGDPGRYGLDFMIAAVCTASAATLWERRQASNDRVMIVAIAGAAAAALVAQRLLPGGWYIIIAGVVGALLGGVLDARKA